MHSTVVQAPASLLLDPGLSPAAKLVWMVLRLQFADRKARPAVLESQTGLSRKTVLRGLAQLEACAALLGIAPGAPASGAMASVPGEVLSDRRLGIQSRVLYGQLQLTPGFRHPTGQFTYNGLSHLTGVSLHTVRRALRELVVAGLLQVAQQHQFAPVHFSFHYSAIARGEAEAARAQRRLDKAPFAGEALMREYLSVIVASDEFEDDAAPGFLVNPWSEERMELDRFYPPSVAFEFNGPQHYRATAWYSAEKAARQRSRDYTKMGICVDRKISLVVVLADDLSYETMQQKVGGLLPLRPLTGHEVLIAMLQRVSRRYRAAVARDQEVIARGDNDLI